MIAADTVDTAKALSTLGVPGLVIVILALCGVILVLFRLLLAAHSDTKAVQEARLQDMKEIAEKYGKSSEQQTILIQQIYDFVSNANRRR